MIQIVFVEMPTVADVYKKKFIHETDIFGSAVIGRLSDGSFAKKQIQCELIGETRYITLALHRESTNNLQISQI